MSQFKRPPIQPPTIPQSPFGQTESAPFQLPLDQQTLAYPQESPGYIESAPFQLPWGQQISVYPPESPVYPGLSPFQSTWGQQISAYPSAGASSAVGPARLPVPQTGFPQGALPLDPAAPASTENHYQESSAYPYPEQRTQFRPPPFRPSWDQSPAYSQQLVDVQQQQSIYPEQQSLLYAPQQSLYQPLLQQPAPPLQTKKKSHRKVLWIGLVLVIVLMVGLGALASQVGNSSTNSNADNNSRGNATLGAGNTVASTTTRVSGTPAANSEYVTSTPAATASQITGTPTSTISSTGSGTWTTINSYTGSGIQQTKTFTVGNDWKILWSCEGPSVDGTPTNGVLGVFIHAQGKVLPIGVPVKVTCNAGTTLTSGSMEEHSGGVIYLIIEGTSNWTIQIQELK